MQQDAVTNIEFADQYSRFDAIVGRVLRIEDVTTGNPEKDYIVRYRGRLYSEDSEIAYEQITRDLAPYGVTPLFRWDEERHAVLLVPARPVPKPSNPRVNLIMFLLTLLSVTLTGGLVAGTEITGGGILDNVWRFLSNGWPFSLALLGILGAHEFGHYLVGRYHGVQLTLPYFIPFPLSLFGTMGAVINMKEMPKNRRHLLDIGLAGPLAGLVVAIPVILIGLSLSTLDPIPRQFPQGMVIQMEGNSLLYLALKYIMFGQLLPAPASYDGMSPVLYWLQYFFTGRPAPLGGLDVMLHPVALAGWGGMLVTALNLIPAGQLDGGHVMYTLFGRRRASRMVPYILGTLAVLGLFWFGWWLWMALIFFLGRTYAEPLDQITPLDGRRRALAIFALILFFLVFTPVPINIIGGM